MARREPTERDKQRKQERQLARIAVAYTLAKRPGSIVFAILLYRHTVG